MPERSLRQFFLSIVLPSILAIILFIISFYAVIIPAFEQDIMERKKEMLLELTNTAWSLLDEYHDEYLHGNMSLEEAQKMAASRVGKMRYGSDLKDYFWIIDMQPVMVMHPYRSELNTTNLSEFKDPNGTMLFMESVRLVEKQSEGYINYMWQWKDDSTRIVPKLSFVKSYPEWGWILGTGVYLDDVQAEIRALKRRLWRVSAFIIIIIGIGLFYIVRQSLIIENKRRDAERKLLLSRQKYKSLVEASTEGTLMMIDEKIIFANLKLNKMVGCSSVDILNQSFEDLFEVKWMDILDMFDDSNRSVNMETKLKCVGKPISDVIISVSKLRYGKQNSYIVITKDVTRQKRMEQESANLSQELQTSLLLMNQPIKHFVKEIIKCPLETTAAEAASIMGKKKQKLIFVSQEKALLGVVTNSDLTKRVLAKGLDPSIPISEIMSAPVSSISENALLYEAMLKIKHKGISHLLVRSIQNEPIGSISYSEALEMQQNSVSYLVKEIESAENIHQIKRVHDKVPVLCNALIDSGDNARNITRIITSVSDAITRRVIELAIESEGKAPCRFAFIAMGSEGRKEQTLTTDQDNAIIFEDLAGGELENANAYFMNLAHIINKGLNEVGYKFCKGEVMAMNPKWTQPFSIWKQYFTDWTHNSNPHDVLEATIFFDFRCIYGDTTFTDLLAEHVDQSLEHKSIFFHHLAQSVIKYKAPVNIFGNIVGNNELKDPKVIDIKKVILPVITYIRIYSLTNHIRETNSLDRVEKLKVLGKISQAQFDELVLAYNYLMGLRFRFQAKALLKNQEPTNMVDTGKLTHIELSTLKKVFGEIGNLQSQVGFDFKGGN